MPKVRILSLTLVLLTLAGWGHSASADSDPPIDKKSTHQRAGPDWWSLQPIRRAAVPEPVDNDWRGNPIDCFIKAKLEQSNLSPSQPADPRTFIRRVTLDLTGLLPTPEEVALYLKDAAAGAKAA